MTFARNKHPTHLTLREISVTCLQLYGELADGLLADPGSDVGVLQLRLATASLILPDRVVRKNRAAARPLRCRSGSPSAGCGNNAV